MARKLKTDIEEPMKQDESIAPTNFDAMADDSSYQRSRCGGALRQARETQGLSVQEVASKLRLGLKQIDAIEADQFEKLPEPTIVRGFIRNYAKLLKMNPEPLLDAYTVIVPSKMQYEMTVKPTSNMLVTSSDKPKSSNYIWAGLLALLALGAWLFYQNYIAKPNLTKPSTSIESASKEALELPEVALPAAERAPAETTTLMPSTELTLPDAAADSAAPVESQAVPAGTATLAVTMPATATPNTAVVSALPITAAPITAVPTTAPATTLAPAPKGLVKLEFIATQETWVNVIDAEGKTVYDKIIFAGSRETIEAMQPLNVVVGNAGATSLNVNGKSIELGPHARNNVARIKLE